METYKVTVNDKGTTRWYNAKDEYHRVGGPAIEFSDGGKQWFIEGKRHRIDGPAIEFADGDKEWYKEGKRHRIDGPAIEFSDVGKVWYLEGKEYTEAEYHKKLHAGTCEGKVVEIDGKRYNLTGV